LAAHAPIHEVSAQADHQNDHLGGDRVKFRILLIPHKTESQNFTTYLLERQGYTRKLNFYPDEFKVAFGGPVISWWLSVPTISETLMVLRSGIERDFASQDVACRALLSVSLGTSYTASLNASANLYKQKGVPTYGRATKAYWRKATERSVDFPKELQESRPLAKPKRDWTVWEKLWVQLGDIEERQGRSSRPRVPSIQS
jgi:hypothetical protein